MKYDYRHQDWCNVKVLGKNRLPVRPFIAAIRQLRPEEREKRRKRQLYIAERQLEICIF